MATIIKDLLNKNNDIVHPRTEDNAVLDGGVSLYSRLRAGTSGQVFMSNGANAPSWQTLALDYIKIPETIPASSDLDTYQTAGFYYCPSNATAATLSNCPTTSAFSLLVEKHAGVKQTLTIYLTNNISTWIRNKYSTTWGTWYQILNATGKAVDADKLDGNDSSYFSVATHVHGNISNAGAIGTTATLPIITTTSGVLTTGSFGSSAGTFCQGNDARLSDARTPTTHAHAWEDITSGVPTSFTPADHNQSASTITSGTLAVARGGTGLATVTANSYLKGNGTGELVPRTYAEVLSDIGALSTTGTAADSSKLGGLVYDTASTVSTVVARNSSGDINVRLVREEYADQSTISGGIVFRVNNTTDNFLRVCNSASAIRTFLDVPDTSHTHSYVPTSRTVNSKALSSNISLTASDVGAQPTITYGTGSPSGGSSGDIYVKYT